MTIAIVILCLLVGAFVCAGIGAARSRDTLHSVNAVLLAIVLLLVFVARRTWLPSLLVFVALGGLAACGSPQPTPAAHAQVMTYEAELEAAEVACAKNAASLEESHACRAQAKARINAKYGRDGGT